MSVFPVGVARNQYGWAPFDLEAWFDYLQSSGWITYYQAASQANGEGLAELMAQGSKEGGIYFFKTHPDGNVLGDHEEAFGLHQCHALPGQTSADLLPVDKNVMEASRRLAANRVAIRAYLEKSGDTITPDTESALTYDAYNRGVVGEERAYEAHPADPDTGTANNSYYADIKARAVVMTELLVNSGYLAATPAPTGPDPED
jgi:hypothetical protein